MYEVTVQAPGIDERTFTCNGPSELRNLVWGVARAQGQPIGDDRSGKMIAEVGDLWSRADIEGVGLLEVHECTVQVEPAADESAYACEGHEGEDAVLLGGPSRCDGSCKPRSRFTRHSVSDLAGALDDADLDAQGGCGACSLEAGQMCVACGRCNCDRHDSCKRPAAGSPAAHCTGPRCSDCRPDADCCEVKCGCCPRVEQADLCWVSDGAEDDVRFCSEHGERLTV